MFLHSSARRAWQGASLLPILFAGVLAGCGETRGAGEPPGFGGPPPQVQVMVVQPQTLPVSFEYTGQTQGSREVEVRARVTGILLTRNYTEGSSVRAGQSLFTIDPVPFQTALARAEADRGAAQARHANAQRQVARVKPLADQGMVSKRDYDDALAAEQVAAADVKAADARVTEARLNLGYTRVVAPVSGLAGGAGKSEGSLVSGPDVLLTTIVQTNPIKAVFGIARRRARAHPGRHQGKTAGVAARRLRSGSRQAPTARCWQGRQAPVQRAAGRLGHRHRALAGRAAQR